MSKSRIDDISDIEADDSDGEKLNPGARKKPPKRKDPRKTQKEHSTTVSAVTNTAVVRTINPGRTSKTQSTPHVRSSADGAYSSAPPDAPASTSAKGESRQPQCQVSPYCAQVYNLQMSDFRPSKQQNIRAPHNLS